MTENTENISPPQKSSCAKRSIIFITLFGIVLIGLFFLGNYYYEKVFSRVVTVQNNLFLAQKNMSSMEQQVRQLTELLQNQNESMNTLRQTQSGYNRDQWRMIEADFLVKLAYDTVKFENNIPQAISLLNAADQQIRALNDAQLLPLRKALASDIANLQAVTPVDVPGIYLRLYGISEQISKLPLPNKPTQNLQTPSPTNEKMPWWKRGLEQTWQQLQQIVIVRYHNKGVLPLMLPEQHDFLLQNTHAILEKAMWGLLHKQKDVYLASLVQAYNWINQYFVSDSPITQSVIKEIIQLEKTDINPALPQNFASLQAFKDYFVSQHQ